MSQMENISRKEKTKDRRIKIGVVGVDSGQLLVCDPCYVQSEPELSDYDTLLAKQDESDVLYTQLNFGIGRAGAGVVFHSGLGDGVYEIYATIGEVKGWGTRIKKVEIILIP